MNLLRTASFKKNVRRLIMLIGAVGATVTCGGFVIYGVVSSRSQTSWEFSELARIVGLNCSDALATQDHETARDTLLPLLTDSRISAVHLLDRENQLFVELRRDPGTAGTDVTEYAQGGTYQIGNHVIVSLPIPHGRRNSGTIVLEGDLASPLKRSAHYWPFGLSMAAVLLVVAYALSFALEPVISSPIMRLTEDASRVVAEAGEPVTGSSKCPGEIGQLVVRLNELGAIIDEKNRLLTEAEEHMEERVAERTLELSADVERCHRTEARLRHSLDEKESLLNEIHHRVKNNLQIVSSLLNLQAGHVADDGARESLKESRDRILSIALLHEMFSQSEDLGQIELAPYLRRMCSELAGACASESVSVHTRLSSAPVWVDMEQAISLGLIIHELVSNSTKYAFPHQAAGEVRIDLRSTNGTIRLEVADDGVGIPERVEWRQPTTLGMQLVQALSRQLSGKIELDRQGGTAFVLSIPMVSDEEEG